MFAPFTRRPLGWSQIDALASLEEREESIEGATGKEDPGRPIAPKPPAKDR
jgi:hypothetical protein